MLHKIHDLLHKIHNLLLKIHDLLLKILSLLFKVNSMTYTHKYFCQTLLLCKMKSVLNEIVFLAGHNTDCQDGQDDDDDDVDDDEGTDRYL